MIVFALIAILLFFFLKKNSGASEEAPANPNREKDILYTPELRYPAQHKIFNPNAKAISDAENTYGVPAWVIVGLINTESGGNANTRGSKGEIGLMQLYPEGAIADWRKKFGVVYSDEFFKNSANNIKVGAWFLAEIHRRTGANWLNTPIHAYQVGANGYLAGRRSPDRDARLKRFTEAVLIFDANEYTA